LLDDILTARTDLARASSGRTKLLFEPDPDKTFHRGTTDYFSRGRQADIGAFDTPAFVGVPLGTITRVGPDCFDLTTEQPLANGDGLTYLHKREVFGMQANTVAALAAQHWRVWPNEPIASLPGLKPGVAIGRNRDHAWEQALNRKSAERHIEITATFTATDQGYALTLRDSDGIAATAALTCDKQAAQQADQAAAALREQLGRFGGSDFSLRELVVETSQSWFVPNSSANALRRAALDKLIAARRAAYRRPLRRPAAQPPARYPDDALTYLANVLNSAARAFYTKHGVKLIAAAYEAHEETGDVPLMITKHCLRYSFSLCPKQAKGVTGVQGQLRADAMVLVNGNERLRLEFDCKACEMHVIGRLKKHVGHGAPASAPVHFQRRPGAAAGKR
jgi:putative protease